MTLKRKDWEWLKGIDKLLTRPEPTMTADEAEAAVRHAMRDNIDDLAVSFQVINARRERSPCILMHEHICLHKSYADCARGTHGYFMRCHGPLTREAHDEQEARIERMPVLMAEISASLAEGIAKARALKHGAA